MKNPKYKITKQDIRSALKNTSWDYGNNILYSMCKKAPNHKQIDQIVAKIWLIGRSYSAAIERRKVINQESDSFYVDEVALVISFIRKLYAIEKEAEINELSYDQIYELRQEKSKSDREQYCQRLKKIKASKNLTGHH